MERPITQALPMNSFGRGGREGWECVARWQQLLMEGIKTELEDTRAANDVTLAVRAERELDLEEQVADLNAQVARLKSTIATATRMVDVWHTRAVDAEWQLRQLRGLREVGE